MKLNIDYGIHIIFSNIPPENDKVFEDGKIVSKFEKEIEKSYFTDFREEFGKNCLDSSSDIDILYSPLKFYMLGDQDVLYITLINNFKFSHRLFEPITNNNNNFNPHSFQSYSGFVLNQDSNQINKIFENKKKPLSYFVAVINLKLNNGLYIGNGFDYISSIYSKIEFVISEIGIENFLINKTFSWFEISVIVFINNPDLLSELLSELRLLTLNNLDDKEKLLTNSLYKEIQTDDDNKIYSTSLFSDSNSHFGFSEMLINESEEVSPLNTENEYLLEFYNSHVNTPLKTEIEWQVKPGHFYDLISHIKREPNLLDIFFKNDDRFESHMVLGKCDYYLAELNGDRLISNFILLRYIARDNKLYEYIRKVRTYLFFENNKEFEVKNTQAILNNEELINLPSFLKKLSTSISEIKNYDDKLRTLKVSRHIRNKVLKVFSNFNNGILDPIQFTYFLDFSVLIEKLKQLIDSEYDDKKTVTKKINEITVKLVDFIDTFQEAYNVRYLNGYQFESISDFDLDFNNSIQQLLSNYGILVYEYGKLIRSDDELYGPVIQLNDMDTVSDPITINYTVHHLTSPELVFTTITKEVLNPILKYSNQFPRDDFKKVIKKLKKAINDSYFDDLIISESFDLDYFITDVIRFIINFKKNFDLFQHWVWTYNFQNTSLYDTDGMFNEDYLKMEMLRLMMIQKYFRLWNDSSLISEKEAPLNSPLECPIPNLKTYWILHFDKLDKLTDLIFEKYSFLFDSYKKTILEMEKNYQIKSSENEFSDNVFNSLIVSTLNDQYYLNCKKISLLDRSWNSGIIIPKKHYPNVLYAIDQIGSQYFYSNYNMQKYFKKNAMVIIGILDFGTKRKKDFIIRIIKKSL